MIETKESLIGSISSKESLSGSLNVGVEKVYPSLQEKIATPSGEIQEITADNGVYGLSKVTVNKVNLQDKTVDPTTEEQIISADSEFAGLNKITINPIPTQERVATPTKDGVTIIPDENKFLSKVDVLGDNNLIPENIAEGKSIFGVEGTGKLEQTEWKPEPDWWDIDAVYQDFMAKNPNLKYVGVILIRSDGEEETQITTLSSVNIIKSDGEELYLQSSGITKHTLTWDTSKDKECSKGYKTRYIIMYHTGDGSYIHNNITKEYIFGSETLYMIINGNVFANYSSGGSSCMWRRKFLLQCIKIYTHELEIPTHVFFSMSKNEVPVLQSLISDMPFKFKKTNTGTYNSLDFKDSNLKYPILIESFPEDVRLSLYSMRTNVGKTLTVNKNNAGSGANRFYNCECEKIVIEDDVKFTSLSNAFNNSYFHQLNDDNSIDCSEVTNLSNAFNYHRGLREITLKNSNKVTNFQNFLDRYSDIRKITIDVSGATSSLTSAFNRYGNCELWFIGEIPLSLTISYGDYSLENIIHILEHLKDLTGATAQTLIIGSTNKTTLQNSTEGQEALALAISKNWTVS